MSVDHQQPRRRRVRLSPAFVVAMLALVLAATGVASGDGNDSRSNAAVVKASASVSAHAARTPLRRNSVGTAQLRTGAVHKVDIAPTTIKSLKGAKGDPGPAGAPGAPGVSATAYFAAISGAGDRLRGNATGAAHLGVGHYTVTFAKSMSDCVPSLTLGSVDATPPPSGTPYAVDEGGKVGVYIRDSSNNPVDQMFYLTVTCAP